MNGARYFQTLIGDGRLHVRAMMAVILLSSVFPVDLFPNAPHEIQGADGQYSGKQGQVLLIRISAGSRPPM